MIRIPGNIPISIYPFFWLLTIAIGWINTFNILGTCIWVAVILFSVLMHEYGHALTAIFFGQKAQIDLVAFGGLTQRRGGKLKLWQEFIIVMNGPLAGLLLGVLAFGIQQIYLTSSSPSVFAYMVKVTFYVNVFWTILNLVPVQPLDGGKLLSIILESIFGLRGVKIALFVSLILSAFLGLFFFAVNAVIVGIMFLMMTFDSYRAWKNSMAATEQDQNLILQHLLRDADRDIYNGYKDQALEKFQHIRETARAGLIYQNATEHAAALLVEKGDFKAAYDMLRPICNKLSADSLRTLHQLAYRQGQWEEAVSLGTRAYQSYPTCETAILNALSLSILGKARLAIGWLQCAVREGLPNLQEILAKGEFDNIRNDPLFQELKNQHS